MLFFLLFAVVITAVAAVYDQRTGRMPNWLTLGGCAAGVVGHLLYGWWSQDLSMGLYRSAFALGGALFCSLAPVLLFYKGGMGGGDVKLFAAIGALCHPMLGIEAQLYSFVIAAVLAPARLAYEGRFFAVFRRSATLLLNPLRKADKREPTPPEMLTWFRLGPAIFLGTAATAVANGLTML